MFKRIITLFSLALFALAPLGAARAQQSQQLNLIRDAEIENTIRALTVPIWRAAGLDPNGIEIMIVQDNSLNAFVAGGQRIFINTGLIMRTETPNQLIGVMAHESGHIAGGHLVRMQEELRNLSTLQILETILGAGALAGGAVSGSGMGRGGGGSTTGAGGPRAPGSLMSFLHYTQTQESAADQAAMSYLQRTGQSPKGTIDFLKILQKEERLQMNRRDPYLTTHPLTPERIERLRAGGGAVALRQHAGHAAEPQHAPPHGGQADGLRHARHRAGALRRGRPLGAGTLCPRHRLVPQGRAGLGPARHRRADQGISRTIPTSTRCAARCCTTTAAPPRR